MTTTLQVQARALGDPTRHAVFRYLVDAVAPVTVAELTAHVGLHHNAIRQHLAKLTRAGLVIESVSAPGGRGRPRLLYTVEPTASARWGSSGSTAYERLSELLAEIIRSGDAPVDVGRRAGRRLTTGDERTGGGVERVVATMAREGFDPVLIGDGPHVDVILQTCPFRSTALADPDVVCDVHLGLAEGLVEGTDVAVVDLVREDPRRARCRLALQPVTVQPAVRSRRPRSARPARAATPSSS